MIKWEVKEAQINTKELDDLLDVGWEPFSAYLQGETHYSPTFIVLRKSYSTERQS